MKIEDFNLSIFADGADLENIISLSDNSIVKGFTTNPTLMKQSGVTDYEAFAKSVLSKIKDKPVSFEVFADDIHEMEAQAKVISKWGENVNVKIPVTNTKGEFTGDIIRRLSNDGVKLNVTAIFDLEQVKMVVDALNPETDSIVSIFAGRIADTGRDPIPYMKEAKSLMSNLPNAKLLWASPREVLNIYQAEQCGCDIITVTEGLLSKLKLKDKDLKEFSLETVSMFYNDAVKSNFKIEV